MKNNKFVSAKAYKTYKASRTNKTRLAFSHSWGNRAGTSISENMRVLGWQDRLLKK
jgi:hypothetical protein